MFEEPKFIVSLLEVLSSLSALCFGLYGVLNDTKPKDGKLTRKGKIAVIGVIISGAILVTIKATQAYNTHIELEKSKADLVESEKRNREEQHFKKTVDNQLRKSLDSLNTLSKKADATIDKTKEGLNLQNINLRNQGAILNYALKEINAIFPLAFDFSFEIPATNLHDYLKTLDALRNDIEDELFDAELQFEGKELTSKYGEIQLKYLNKYKIIPGIKGSKVEGFVLMDTTSPFFPKNKRTESIWFRQSFKILITKDNIDDLKRLDAWPNTNPLWGIGLYYQYSPQAASDEMIIIKYENEPRIYVSFSINDQSLLKINDNSLTSLIDLSGCHLIVETDVPMRYITLKSGINFHQSSTFRLDKDMLEKRRFLIHKIMKEELGIIK